MNQDIEAMIPLVAVIMGSKSDWEVLSNTSQTLDSLGIPHDVRILSAHRTPDQLMDYVMMADKGGVEVFIAAAGGAAHLAGVVAAKTEKPVLGVPMESKSLHGLDSLLSMVQMPAGIPVGTLAIGKAGAVNAALLAAAILGLRHDSIKSALHRYREGQVASVLAQGDPRAS